MALQTENAKLTRSGLVRPLTNIDRRNCRREVPMKVLCLGLGRTGTASLRAALVHLGISDVYHMHTTFNENPLDASMWVEAIDAKYSGIGKPYGKEEFDKLLGHCMAISDFPCIMFAEELIAAYPDAKILLTVRDDVETWCKSMLETQWTGKFMFAPPTTIFQAIIQYVVPRPPAWPVVRRIYAHTPLDNFPTEGREWYIQYNEKIRTLAKGKQFLEYNVKEGWGPLCKFLEVNAPDIPFPRVNDTKAWQDLVEDSKMRSILDLLGKAGKVCVPIFLGSIVLWYMGTR